MIHLEAIQRIHLIGIKGSGMTALAQVLQSQGKKITGSDQAEVFFTDQILRDLNIAMVETMSPANISDDIELVVVSAAWEQHPETLRAKELNIPIVNYPEMLGILSAGRSSIGVSGTHGKTTTTALLGLAAINLGLDPTVIVGSQVPQFHNTNAATGKGDYLIAETCEYRRHFLNFHPSKIIITNIEPDHLDYFHDLEDIIFAFQQYIDRLPTGGTVVCCIDSSAVRTLLQKITRTDIEIMTYGEAPDAHYQLINHRVAGNKQRFQIVSNGHTKDFSMQIPGKHNCLNATAVYALCQALLAPNHQTEAILDDTIATYQSTTRRMQYKGKRGNMLVYDDYGHHPTEISATLKALREFF
nr:UDP-N-acetylmuramate--L-alanine ligase [Candidatus Gracilibacteria bacterium]